MLEEMLVGSSSDALLQVLQRPLYIPITLSHTVESITNGEVGSGVTFKLVGCQFRLPGHLGRLSDHPICLLGSMWPTVQTSKKAVISTGLWRFPFSSGSKLALLHPNKWLQTHFVLLAKIFAQVVLQLTSQSIHCKYFLFIINITFVHWNCVDCIYKNLGGLMER